MRIITFVIIALLLAMTFAIRALNYKTGVGARLGFFNGLTVKHFLNPNNTIEGVLNFIGDNHVWADGLVSNLRFNLP